MILSGKDIYIKNINNWNEDKSIRFGFDITNLAIEDRLNQMKKNFFEKEEYHPSKFIKIKSLVNFDELHNDSIKYMHDNTDSMHTYFNIYIKQSDNINIMDGLTFEDVYKTEFKFDEKKKYLVRIKIKHVYYFKHSYILKYTLDCPIQETKTSEPNEELVIEDCN
jgi:hypothetical protein